MASGNGRNDWLKRLALHNQGVRELLAELIGTMILVSFGVGAGIQGTLGGPGSTPITGQLAGAMGVMLAISVAGGVSGGGVNPAVSLGFCLTNRTPWRMYPLHLIGQFVGAFVGTGLIYAVYQEGLDEFLKNKTIPEAGPTGSAAMFTSFPQDYLSAQGGFLDQVVGTGALIFCIQCILDKYNMNAPNGLKPFLVGLLVFTIGGSMGLNCGAPLNPARDFAPRLFLLAAGWSTEVISYRNYNWFWVPIVAPLVGSAVGTFLYYAFVGWHWSDKERGKDSNSYTLGNDRHVISTLSKQNSTHVELGSKGVENLGYHAYDDIHTKF